MLAQKIRVIIDHAGITQGRLAATLGIPLNRVKNLVNGRVQKLAPNESQALVERLHVNPTWLTTGEGAVFLNAKENTLDEDLEALKFAEDSVAKLSLPKHVKDAVGGLVYAVQIGKTGLVEKAIKKLSLDSGKQIEQPFGERERLRLAIEAVEEGLAAIDRKLPPDKKARLILAAFDLMAEPNEAKSKVVELIRFVA